MTIEWKVCAKESPYTLEQNQSNIRWEHPDAYEIGDQYSGWPGGDLQSYRCPHCGIEFETELPQ